MPTLEIPIIWKGRSWGRRADRLIDRQTDRHMHVHVCTFMGIYIYTDRVSIKAHGKNDVSIHIHVYTFLYRHTTFADFSAQMI